MCDGRPAEPRYWLDLMRARDEVDRDRVLVARHREGCGLAGCLDERNEMRSCDVADIEARENGVRQVHEPDAEPIAARGGHPLDETRRCERPELARDRARCHARTPSDFVRSQLAGISECVEDRDRSLGGANSAGGWLTGARHPCRFVAESGTALLRVQFTD